MLRISVFFLVVNLSCTGKVEEEYYGEYSSVVDGEELVLNISTENEYEISIITYIREDIIELKPISKGRVNFENGVITLHDSSTAKDFYLGFRLETLEIENAAIILFDGEKEIKVSDRFYCFTRFYKNGKVRYSGSWENGKKCGGWRFYDKDGNLMDTQIFPDC